MCQAANGSFPAKLSVGKILEVDIDKIVEAGAGRKEDTMFVTAWVTMVVIVFLMEKCGEEKDVWELVVDKARNWLKNCGVDSMAKLEKKAKDFVYKI